MSLTESTRFCPCCVTSPRDPGTRMRLGKARSQRYRAGANIHVLEPCEGRAHAEICRLAAALKVDLIVIATHGYTKYQRAFLGSTAERVVQRSPCPVIVVRQLALHLNGTNGQWTRTGFRLGKILVPTDFSGSARKALTYAGGLVRDFNAELRLVRVVNSHVYPFGDEFAALDAEPLLREATQAAQKTCGWSRSQDSSTLLSQNCTWLASPRNL